LKTCFLIDDDEDDRDIFQLALQQLGPKFNCVTSDSCTHALEILKNGNVTPDYIFLDLNMPVITGRECLAEIRKLEKFGKTPVLIYTTSSVLKDKEDVMRLGATSFITKPNKVSVLTTVLKEILNPS
jgi:CheY-like chemotaxis protein